MLARACFADGDGVDVGDAGSGDDHLVVRDLCEVQRGDIFAVSKKSSPAAD